MIAKVSLSLGAIMIAMMGSFYLLDIEAVSYFHNFHEVGVISFFRAITLLGQAEYVLIPALLVALYYKKRDAIHAAKAWFVFASVAVAGVGVWPLKILFGRFRPELYFEKGWYGFDFFHIHHSMTSFPSGHSATSVGAATALAILFPRFRLIFMIVALLVMMSRVVIVRHFPSDVLAGGVFGMLVAWWLYERYFKARIADV